MMTVISIALQISKILLKRLINDSSNIDCFSNIRLLETVMNGKIGNERKCLNQMNELCCAIRKNNRLATKIVLLI